MNIEQYNNEMPQRRAADMDENAKLKIENAFLRGAAEHFLYCDVCDGKNSRCATGYNYAMKLHLFCDEKAV